MPTLAQLRSEPWWDREIVTPELRECCDAIAAGLGIARSNVGTKGDEHHMRGHHRSQEWILNSRFCTSRTYTVQTGLTAEQARHIAAIDIVPGVWGTTENRRRTAAITARLIAAMKAGELDEVFEVYGGAADLETVTGYNNRENRTASSDDSHLDHPHIGCDRRKMRDRAFLARLASIVIGDDMSAEAERQISSVFTGVFRGGSSCGKPVAPEYQDTKDGSTAGNSVFEQFAEVRGVLGQTHAATSQLVAAAAADEARDRAALAAIQALATAGGVDAAPIIAAVNSVRDELGGQLGDLRVQLAASELARTELQQRLAAALTAAPAGS